MEKTSSSINILFFTYKNLTSIVVKTLRLHKKHEEVQKSSKDKFVEHLNRINDSANYFRVFLTVRILKT